MNLKTATFNFLFLILISQAFAQSTIETIPIIPIPKQISIGQGYFNITSNTVLCYSDSTVFSDITLFNKYLKEKYGFQLDLMLDLRKPPNVISISSNKNIPGDNYTIKIDSGAIEIDGGTNAGVFYALQTLIELLPPAKASVLNVPSLYIEDGPAFKYRGMHLDVARHFFSVEVVKRYIDHLALYKMNTFHWHLTDDQGWRIEIKKFPKLQKIGAWRNGTLIGHYFNQPAKYDSIRYGGFYTQEEIKDVVQYAAARHVTIIPEIEMPGHAQAALAAYPELSCTGGPSTPLRASPFEVGKTWGVYQDVFCPYEVTFDFLEKVLDEVCALFPGKYIHIGGDECPKDRWKESEFCQNLIKDKNLGDENGLQRYFTNRIASYLKTKNKIAIGWDEILDEHLDSTAAIMSWRGYTGAVEGAKKNHDVVMNPYTHCYFDSYQSRLPDTKLAIGGYIPLDMVYKFDPIPDVLNAEQAKHILGAQGNVWTEYISDEGRINEMIFPRMCALSEALWSPKKSKDYSNFTSRLVLHFKFLDFNKINYSNALYDVSSKTSFDDKHGINIKLFSTYPRGEIRFTMNGETPTIQSPVYKDAINVDQSVGIKASLFIDSIQKGRVFSKIFPVSRATGRKIKLVNQPHPEYSTGGVNSLTDGMKGELPWMPNEWLGFQGKDLDATIDLEELQNISRVSVDALREDAGKIFLPIKVDVSYSTDGINFKSAGSIDAQSIEKFNRSLIVKFPVVQARWVRIVAQNANQKDWLMVDEITVE